MLILVSVVLARIVYSAYAATGSLTLTSNANTVAQGNGFTLTLTANTDAAITIAQAKVTFDPSQVSYQGVDYSGSPFVNDSPEAGSGNGYVVVSRFKTGQPYPSGSNVVAKLSFKALADSGNASISVTKNGSALFAAADASDILSSVNTATISLQGTATTPPPPAAPSPNPSSPTGSTSSTTTNTKNGATPTPTGQTNNTATTSGESTDEDNQTPAAAVTQKSTPLKPGSAKLGPASSLGESVSRIIRNVLPVVVISGAVGFVIWFGLHKFHQRPYGFGVHTAPTTPGGGTTATAGPAIFDPTHPTLPKGPITGGGA